MKFININNFSNIFKYDSNIISFICYFIEKKIEVNSL